MLHPYYTTPETFCQTKSFIFVNILIIENRQGVRIGYNECRPKCQFGVCRLTVWESEVFSIVRITTNIFVSARKMTDATIIESAG